MTEPTPLNEPIALLTRGESVVLDATWSNAGQREAAHRVAERTNADLVALHCRIPDEMTADRLEDRAAGPSDAVLDVAFAMAEREPLWAEAVTINTGGPLRPPSPRRWQPCVRTPPAPWSSAAPMPD
ncbi:AAA family ATPase [Streptomyces sp. NPDC056255]|uniref:AAA family ATPase n=1 Tax=Streptomyces sp. NPDC056255 TaxID=3345764 RepID=UPI0035D92968